jgi:hypothetical protein
LAVAGRVGVAGRNRPAEVGGARREAAADRRGVKLLPVRKDLSRMLAEEAPMVASRKGRLEEYVLGVKVTLWASMWISIGGVGNANLVATANMEAKPMKNSVTTCVESNPAVNASAHKPTCERKPRNSEVKTSSVLGKINTNKSVRCGAALLRARLGKLPQSKRSQLAT